MNDFLAQLYNTNGYGDDMEKEASIDMFVKLAEENDIDLDQLSDEELVALAYEAGVLDDEGVEKTADDTEYLSEDDLLQDEEGYLYYPDGSPVMEDDFAEDEGEEKVAEADFAGRIMAHSFWDELGEIEKEAASIRGAYGAVKGGLGRAYGATKGGLERATRGPRQFARDVYGGGTRKAEAAAAGRKAQLQEQVHGLEQFKRRASTAGPPTTSEQGLVNRAIYQQQKALKGGARELRKMRQAAKAARSKTNKARLQAALGVGAPAAAGGGYALGRRGRD